MKNPFQSDDHDPDETPWLRDMVDEAYQPLFVDDETTLKRSVRHFIRAVQDDVDVEEKLIELLETAVEEGNDDTSASLMTAIILGEARSIRAIPALIRCLAWEDDEMLQDGAQVALLRIGASAVGRILEAIEESEDPAMLRSGYGLLGQIGVLEDRELTEHVQGFLRERVGIERRKPRDETAIEELFRASALLGDLEQLAPLKEILESDFAGKHTGLQDVREMLEENPAGISFVATPPPWEARYGWLFEDSRDQARVTRKRSGEVTLSLFGGEESEDDAASEPEDSRAKLAEGEADEDENEDEREDEVE